MEEYNATIVHGLSKEAVFSVQENAQGEAAFLQFEELSSGGENDAKRHRLIRNPGDVVVSINGMKTEGKSFQEVKEMLDESRCNRGVSYLVFRDSQNPDVKMRCLKDEINLNEQRVLQLENEIIQRRQSVTFLKKASLKKKDELNRLRAEEYLKKLAEAVELQQAESPESPRSVSPSNVASDTVSPRNEVQNILVSPTSQTSISGVCELAVEEHKEADLLLSADPTKLNAAKPSEEEPKTNNPKPECCSDPGDETKPDGTVAPEQDHHTKLSAAGKESNVPETETQGELETNNPKPECCSDPGNETKPEELPEGTVAPEQDHHTKLSAVGIESDVPGTEADAAARKRKTTESTYEIPPLKSQRYPKNNKKPSQASNPKKTKKRPSISKKQAAASSSTKK